MHLYHLLQGSHYTKKEKLQKKMKDLDEDYVFCVKISFQLK